MRVIYIISIVFSFFFLIIMAAGTIGTKAERDNYYDRMLYDSDYDTYGLDDYYENKYVESTEIAVGISMVFFVWAFVVFILSVILVKTTTSRVLSIIALAMTLLMTVWGLMVLDSPRSMSFDEVGVAWILYALIILVFSIIGTIQAFRYHKSKNPPTVFANQFQQPYNQFPQNQFQQQSWQQPNPYQQNYQQQNPQYPQQPYGNPQQPYNPPPQNVQPPVMPPPPQNNPVPPQNPPAPQDPPPPQNPWAPPGPPTT